MMVMQFGGTINAFIESVFNFPTLERGLQVRGLRRSRKRRQGSYESEGTASAVKELA